MKIKYIYPLLSALLVLATASCKKSLDESNVNPNASENAQPDYLLTGVIKATTDTYHYWSGGNTLNPASLFVQHYAKIQYTDMDRYIFSNADFQTLWSVNYSRGVVNLNQIIKLADASATPNYKGVALVWRAWLFSVLTDVYGDIPYTQAGNISEYLLPKYDTQKDVYTGLLNDLKTAQAELDPSGKAIAGDILYGNSITSWKKFANSLRLRIALRIADREPELARQTIAEIQATGIGYISSNSEIAQLAYKTSPNQNPISNLFDTRPDEHRVSKTIVDQLTALNDPRLAIFAQKAVATQTYVGAANGLVSNLPGKDQVSRLGSFFVAPAAPGLIMSYSEVLFNRAEAAARGFISENAATLYNQAIEASLAQYGVSAADIATYRANPAVQYNPANYKKSIGDQKWIALYSQGLEAYTEWRRLDYPQLTPAVGGVLSGQIPVRFFYPGTEQSLNPDGYRAAVAHQGADALTTKLWFDVN